jgi:hypothetical protein
MDRQRPAGRGSRRPVLRSFLSLRRRFPHGRVSVEVRQPAEPFDADHPGMALPVDDPRRILLDVLREAVDRIRDRLTR